jgi:hypothetical protein
MDDDFSGSLFMPFKWASISEIVHTGEDLCSTSLAALMTGGRGSIALVFVVVAKTRQDAQ